MFGANQLTESLRQAGLTLRRFKTGTPPRVNARSVDFSRMERQPGDEEGLAFSFQTERPPENRAVCWLTYTNEKTHEILRGSLDRSPMFGGVITGTAPGIAPALKIKWFVFPINRVISFY